MNLCKYTKSDSDRCGAYASLNGQYCFRHDPNNREIARSASQKGGLNRRLQGQFGGEVTLNSPSDVKAFLGTVINAVWTGQAPVQVGTSMGFLARCYLDAHAASEFDQRLKELEKKIGKP